MNPMSIFNRLLICCVVAIPASAIYFGYTSEPSTLFQFDTTAALSFLIVAIACVFLTGIKINTRAQNGGSKPAKQAKKKAVKGGRQQGEVKWFNGGKGFGFINCDNGDEIFVHFRSVRKDSPRLSPGKRVEFMIVAGAKGQEADDVEVID
jgi:CspA family cold shock protein